MDQVFYSKSGLSSLKPPRTMQIKIGQIYKVKPEFRTLCHNFYSESNSVYVRYFEEKMEVLDENKQIITTCSESYKIGSACFSLKHLEPFEKTLYNLEIGDEVEDYVGRRKIIGLIESSSENPVYVVSDSSDYKIARGLFTAKGMSRNNYKVVQPEPTEEIKEMTVEEVSKLVGKKVKIVE